MQSSKRETEVQRLTRVRQLIGAIDLERLRRASDEQMRRRAEERAEWTRTQSADVAGNSDVAGNADVGEAALPSAGDDSRAENEVEIESAPGLLYIVLFAYFRFI